MDNHIITRLTSQIHEFAKGVNIYVPSDFKLNPYICQNCYEKSMKQSNLVYNLDCIKIEIIKIIKSFFSYIKDLSIKCNLNIEGYSLINILLKTCVSRLVECKIELNEEYLNKQIEKLMQYYQDEEYQYSFSGSDCDNYYEYLVTELNELKISYDYIKVKLNTFSDKDFEYIYDNFPVEYKKLYFQLYRYDGDIPDIIIKVYNNNIPESVKIIFSS